MNSESPQAATVAEGLPTPQDTADRMWALWGKEQAYMLAEHWGQTAPFWEDVAGLLDAMSPCELCGKPGVGFYNDVFCCEERHG